MSQPLSPLRIGQHIARHPIVQGAMAVRVSGGNLAGAVANAGGVGVISTLGLGLMRDRSHSQKSQGQFFEANRLALIEELQKARAISPDGVIGVNIITATRDYPELAQVAAAHGANLIITAAGLPLQLPEYVNEYPEVALVPMVCGVEAAQKICQAWQTNYGRLPDAFAVENSRAVGGHFGTTCDDFSNTINYVLPAIQQMLLTQFGQDIPLIATGGVWDRADVDAMLALGAKGVQVGTRFITTHECDADPRYKEFHLKARADDVMIVPSPVGKPARALGNAFAERAIAKESSQLERQCVANCLEACLCRDRRATYCIIQALAKAASGDIENGLVFSGANVGRAERLMSVVEVMDELTQSPVAFNFHGVYH
ncbi:MAG TPA: nitronate monooxygenase family protein [Crinalium sp.]